MQALRLEDPPDLVSLLPFIRLEWPAEDLPQTDAELITLTAASCLPDKDTFFLLLNGDEQVGFSRYSLWPRDVDRPDEAHIFDIAVSIAHQGQGGGRMLMDAMADECRARGLRRIFSRTFFSNAQSARFHRSYGFREAFRTKDSLVWVLELPER